jgi:hypothetical protein
LSSPEEREKELEDLDKVIGDAHNQDMPKFKSDLDQQYKREIAMAKECASRGDSAMAIFHRNVAESIAGYLKTLH